MSQKSEAQILTDLADLKRRVAETEKKLLSLLPDYAPAPASEVPYWCGKCSCPHTPAPAMHGENIWCSACNASHTARQGPCTPASGKRWTLFRDGGPWQVCPTPHVHGPDNGNMIVEHIEVVPAADLDAANTNVDLHERLWLEERKRADAAEKWKPCCDRLECPSHGYAVKEEP